MRDILQESQEDPNIDSANLDKDLTYEGEFVARLS